MNHPFGAQLMTLPQIFENRLFTIPNYQRSYAWDDKQVQELLKDLDHLIDDGVAHRHYTGTLVLTRAAAADEGDYQVVDGQQRLTTLVTALRLLADQLPAADREGFSTLYLRRGPAGADRAVLRLNADTRQFFERVVLGNGLAADEPATLEAHHRLLKARGLIQTWIDARIAGGTSAAHLRTTFETELGFLVYAPAEDAETGIMFEVINNRGKPLSELEKVKNYLIYCCVKLNATTLRADIDQDWSQILRHLNVAKKTSPEDEGAFIRYCMVVFFRLNKTDSQNSYDELKELLALDASMKDAELKPAIVQKMTNFVIFMKSAALWFSRLYGQNHEGLSADLISVLEQIRGQDRQASIMPLFLSLVIRNKDLGPTLLHLLSLLEKLNFRVYMARNIVKRNDSGQGELYSFASSYYREKIIDLIAEQDRKIGRAIIEDDHQALEYKLVEFVMYYSPDAPFERSLTLESKGNDDFYKWSGLRYFLMSYEQKLQPKRSIQIDQITLARSEGKSGDYLSVEHRWAVKNRSGEGENNRIVDEFQKRRLGNFVLLELRLNIQGGNGSLEDKQECYVAGKGEEPPTNLQQVRRMFKDAITAKDEFADQGRRLKNYYLALNTRINDLAEDRLRGFALTRWSLEKYLGYKELKKRAETEDGNEE